MAMVPEVLFWRGKRIVDLTDTELSKGICRASADAYELGARLRPAPQNYIDLMEARQMALIAEYDRRIGSQSMRRFSLQYGHGE